MATLRVCLFTAANLTLALVLPAAAQDPNALVKRGDYLVNGPMACSNCLACCVAFWPVVASMTRSTSWGAWGMRRRTTSRILVS